MPFSLDTSGLVPKPGAPAPAPNDRRMQCKACGRDNRGYTGVPCSDDCPSRSWAWEDLTPFAQDYIAEALEGWSFAPATAPEGGYHWDVTDLNPAEWWCDEIPTDAPAFRPVAFYDLAPETLDRIVSDCAAMALHLRRERMSTTGARAWALRQSGFWPKTWPPVIVQLGTDDKIVFA